MPRKPSAQPNDGELAILRVLWERGPSTVRQVHETLQADRDAGYTSTLKMMQVMLEKGLLKRDESQRPQIYQPSAPEEQTQSRIVRDLVQKGVWRVGRRSWCFARFARIVSAARAGGNSQAAEQPGRRTAMNLPTLLLESPIVHRIGWALLHSLWQGVAIAACFGLQWRHSVRPALKRGIWPHYWQCSRRWRFRSRRFSWFRRPPANRNRLPQDLLRR